MAARKSPSPKNVSRKSAARKTTVSRKRLVPRKEKRGLESGEIRLELADAAVEELVAQVRAAGGAAIGAYREPLSGRPIQLASLPLAAIAGHCALERAGGRTRPLGRGERSPWALHKFTQEKASIRGLYAFGLCADW